MPITMATSVAKKILVADGDCQVLELADALLRKQGYEVVLARDAREALGKALSESPDVILLDDSLPGMGHTDIYTMLKSNRATQKIPLGFLTGLQAAKGREAVQQGGVLLFLPKPLKPQQLISSVSLLVSAMRKSTH
ncbi:MAG: two-component system response regulator [Terriglobia bacterium]